MSLPWLESVPVWGETAKGKPVEAPRRFAAVFWGNGVNVKHWGARETRLTSHSGHLSRLRNTYMYSRISGTLPPRLGQADTFPK